jgi:hypothetical protein
MNPALDQRDPLLMRKDHLDHFDHAPHHNRCDGDQPDAKIYDRLHHRESTPANGFTGGADRDRTGGLLVANQALSQLSYSPNPSGQWSVASGQKKHTGRWTLITGH